MKKHSFVIVIIFLVTTFFLISQVSKTYSPANIKIVKIAGQNIKVDLALNSREHKHGLSGRNKLGGDEGMLFVFNHFGKYPFWMKDMNFAIDIIWISEDLKVVYIKKEARPESYPEQYIPDENAKYVLEVVSGFADENNLKVGDRVEFGY